MTEDEVLTPELEERLRRGLVLLAEQTPAHGAARRRKMGRLQTATLGAAAALAAVLAGPALIGGGGTSVSESQADRAAAPLSDTSADVEAATADDAAGQSLTKSDPAQAPAPAPMAGAAGGDGDAREESAAGDTAMSADDYAANADPMASGRVMQYDLRMLVEQSPRIVVAKVSEVTQGQASDASGGMPYVLATVAVEDALRGPADAQVVAFDYVYDDNSIAAGAPAGAAFAVGDRVLLFLSDTAGTVHDGLTPKHWQVTGGAQGRYAMNGAEPEAPFTLDGVRAEIERQKR
jgi:hypothetical protein